MISIEIEIFIMIYILFLSFNCPLLSADWTKAETFHRFIMFIIYYDIYKHRKIIILFFIEKSCKYIVNFYENSNLNIFPKKRIDM